MEVTGKRVDLAFSISNTFSSKYLIGGIISFIQFEKQGILLTLVVLGFGKRTILFSFVVGADLRKGDRFFISLYRWLNSPSQFDFTWEKHFTDRKFVSNHLPFPLKLGHSLFLSGSPTKRLITVKKIKFLKTKRRFCFPYFQSNSFFLPKRSHRLIRSKIVGFRGILSLLLKFFSLKRTSFLKRNLFAKQFLFRNYYFLGLLSRPTPRKTRRYKFMSIRFLRLKNLLVSSFLERKQRSFTISRTVNILFFSLVYLNVRSKLEVYLFFVLAGNTYTVFNSLHNHSFKFLSQANPFIPLRKGFSPVVRSLTKRIFKKGVVLRLRRRRKKVNV